MTEISLIVTLNNQFNIQKFAYSTKCTCIYLVYVFVENVSFSKDYKIVCFPYNFFLMTLTSMNIFVLRLISDYGY